MNDGTIVFLTSLLIALKNVPLLTKTFSPEVFRVVNFFTKMWVVWKMEPKGNLIELSMFLKYGLTEVEKAPS